MTHLGSIAPRISLVIVLLIGGIALQESLSDAAPLQDNGTTHGQSTVRVGQGSYAVQVPAGQLEPPGRIYRTLKLQGPMPSNRWWSSAAWLPLSENLYAHPLAFRATQQGLGVSYPPLRVTGGANPTFFANYREDMTVSLDGVHADAALVAGYTDWTVDLEFSSADKRLTTRIGHGFPYVYGTFSGSRPVIVLPTRFSIWSGGEGSATLGITVNGNHYGLFCGTDDTWSRQGPYRLRCDGLGDSGYFAIGLLPEADAKTLELFASHAFAFPVDATVTWAYDPATSTVRTFYEVVTEPQEGTEDRVLLALYPHQWQFTTSPLTPVTYSSPRGPMHVVQANRFETHHTYHGILPFMPALGDADADELRGYLRAVMSERTLWPPGLGTGEHDTYWMGKLLNRVAQLIPIAQQVGEDNIHKTLLSELSSKLEYWLTATPPKPEHLFYYNTHWGTLIGYPASHGTSEHLNDHHFHYGYFIGAAAMLALHNPEWAAQGNWGDMIHLLIRDWASPDRADPMFPFLRTFDPYAGHSWASGNGAMREGNNQESSSEAIHAWASLILFGEAVGDMALRDLGIWGYTLETHAANLYWFDVASELFPASYEPPVIGRLYGSGGDYATWWTRQPHAVHAINFLPITAASLYLGQHPDYVRRNYAWLVANKEEGGWLDIIQSYRALVDPEAAFTAWSGSNVSEFGDSGAHTYHWLRNLQQLGQVDPSVTADHPLYAVFQRDGVTTYVAYNAGLEDITVTYSDGFRLRVPAQSMASQQREVT